MKCTNILTRFSLVLLIGVCTFSLSGQEICDNGIDDDGDALVDINDPDCNCTSGGNTINITETFENNSCCPTTTTSECCNTDCCPNEALGCLVSDWQRVHSGTPDYMACGYNGGYSTPSPPQPFPSGTACLGIANGSDFSEAWGICLPSPLFAGIDYNIEFYVGFPDSAVIYGTDFSPFEISLWGRTDCPNFPQDGLTCLSNYGWEEIITFIASGPENSWTQILEVFTPLDTYNAIALGATCAVVSSQTTYFYNYIDEINITGSANNPIFVEEPVLSGDCLSGYTLIANQPDAIAYQWYLEGVAIVGETSQDLNVPTPYSNGNYQVRVFTNEGCGTSEPFLFQPNLEVLSFQENLQNESCPNENDGLIEISTDFINQPVSYNWSNNTTGNSISNLIPDNYSVTITDANGCFGSENYTIEVADEITSSFNDITQPTQTNPFGAATVIPNGGETPFQYIWSNGEIIPNAINLPPGMNFVTITDANECEIIDSILIFEILLARDSIIQNPCNNSCEARIELFVEGGIAPYSYNWSNNETNSSIENLCANTYQVTVSDDFGTELFLEFTIDEPSPIEVNLTFDEFVCSNETTTDITIDVQGGTPGYTFLWNNNSTDQNLSNVGIGNYNLTVTDANDCEAFASANIQLSPAIEYDTIVYRPTCDNTELGSIELIFINGVAPFNLLWNTNETSNLIQDLPAGEYTVEITDGNGCLKVDTFNINSPGNISVEALIENETCTGDTNGSIELDIDGGVTPYQVLWDDNQQGLLRTNLGEGTYAADIIDDAGCQIRVSYSITTLGVLDVETSIDSIGCFGKSDGSISISIENGIDPFAFEWSTNDTTQDLLNISSGTYDLTITDSLSCLHNYTFTLAEKDSISIEAEINPNLCAQDSAGNIIPNVSNGINPIRYLWNTGSTDSILENIPNGIYSITVTDQNECTNTAQFELIGQEELEYSVIVSQENCANTNGGSIRLEFPVEEPLSIVWNDGQETNSRENLAPGLYTITITDINGCIYIENILLENIDQVEIGNFPVQETTFCGLDPIQLNYVYPTATIPTGLIRQFILCTEPTDPFGTQLGILDNLDLNPLLYNLTTNRAYYIVAVLAKEDINGNADSNDPCILFSNDIELVFIDEPRALLPEDFIVCQNESLSIELEVYGLENYTIEYTINDQVFQNTIITGNTFIELTASETTQIKLLALSTTDGFCIQENIDTLNIDINFSDSTIINLETCIPEEVDTLNRIEKNQFGCDSVITEIYSLLGNCDLEVLPNLLPIECNNTFTSIFFDIPNGEGPFQYALLVFENNTISNGILSESNGNFFLDSLIAGNYQITITDINNNTAILEFNIESASLPIITIENTSLSYSGFDVACHNDSSASIEVKVENPINDYSILWSNTSAEARLENLSAGWYVVSVTDNNACTTVDSILITEPDPISILIDEILPCTGESNGNIIVQAEGGIEPFLFQLNDIQNNDGIFENLMEGNYELEIMDANNCVQTEIINLDAQNEIELELGEDIVAEKGEEISINATTNLLIEEIVRTTWTGISSPCSLCLEYDLIADSSFQLYLEIETENGCKAIDFINILIKEAKPELGIFAPNVFSPTSTNNKFFIQTDDSISLINNIIIYDRWGNLMFRQQNFPPNDDQFGWDGRKNNKDCAQGVYVYAITFTTANGDQKVLAGDVTLIR